MIKMKIAWPGKGTPSLNQPRQMQSVPSSWTRTTAVRLGPLISMELVGTLLRLDVKGVQRQFPRDTLDILAYYQETHTLEEGLKFLGRTAKGMQGLADAFTRLIQLCELGSPRDRRRNPSSRVLLLPPGLWAVRADPHVGRPGSHLPLHTRHPPHRPIGGRGTRPRNRKRRPCDGGG